MEEIIRREGWQWKRGLFKREEKISLLILFFFFFGAKESAVSKARCSASSRCNERTELNSRPTEEAKKEQNRKWKRRKKQRQKSQIRRKYIKKEKSFKNSNINSQKVLQPCRHFTPTITDILIRWVWSNRDSVILMCTVQSSQHPSLTLQTNRKTWLLIRNDQTEVRVNELLCYEVRDQTFDSTVRGQRKVLNPLFSPCWGCDDKCILMIYFLIAITSISQT